MNYFLSVLKVQRGFEKAMRKKLASMERFGRTIGGGR